MNKPQVIVFASNNVHKLEEVKHILGNTVSIKSLADIGFEQEVAETADTFAGNALIKAREIFEFCGLPTLADDSGLRVMALNGEPGIFSARYAGLPRSDTRNLEKVLDELQGKTNREAEFVTVLAYINNGLEYIFEGIVKGEITGEKRGANGFGYDPVFQPLGHTKTFAEMTSGEKNSLSHRARAVEAFAEFLNAE